MNTNNNIDFSHMDKKDFDQKFISVAIETHSDSDIYKSQRQIPIKVQNQRKTKENVFENFLNLCFVGHYGSS